ncbi:MAG: hypothetical protein JXJ17_16665 [Anaerolineae bacterium]|nr:hypothetical protein [Anaerolineae bacterium]
MTDNSLGRELPRAIPVQLTFYDRLKDVPFTTTFYVRDDATQEQIEALIKAVDDVSLCVLGEYKIGHRVFVVPDYRDELDRLSPYSIGGQKWVIKYRTVKGSARSISIPGRDMMLSQSEARKKSGKPGHKPDPNHEKWQRVLAAFKAICVSKEGEALVDEVLLDYRNESWPPKSARRR